MHSAARRSHGATPLAIVPPPSQLPHRRSSLLSVTSTVSDPHTPRSCGSPRSSILFANSKRYSTDSWNSSNPPDDLEIKWKPEDASLLARTLDALPAHLVTPFIGPIPPNNLLHKIARGIIQAKGATNWPYSIRATRIKLLELARLRAKEESGPRAFRISEEEQEGPSVDAEDEENYTYNTPNEPRSRPRRPLYRQSSMDFMHGAEISLKDNENITRLSNRLQRGDRTTPSSPYHPYARAPRSKLSGRSPSPALLLDVPSLIKPSTPSVTTLNSVTSLASARVANVRARTIRRSGSVLSASSSGSSQLPLIEVVRRSGAQCETPPPVPPKDKPKASTPATPAAGSKRGPAFGAAAQASRPGHLLFNSLTTIASAKDIQTTTYPSSDEEEKARSKGAKKLRTKDGMDKPAALSIETDAKPTASGRGRSHPTNSPSEATAPKIPALASPIKTRSATRAAIPEGTASGNCATPGKKPMNPDRNPSMFGTELPSIDTIIRQQQQSPLSRRSRRDPTPSDTPGTLPPPTPETPGFLVSPPPVSPSPALTVAGSPMVTESPQTQRVRTLRRVKRLGPARRISFTSLKPDAMDEIPDGEATNTTLGSAIQLA